MNRVKKERFVDSGQGDRVNKGEALRLKTKDGEELTTLRLHSLGGREQHLVIRLIFA
jgi:hypothetical protein